MALECTVSIERARDDIEITLAATNTGEEPVELTFTDGQTIEVVASREGAEVWRYSDGRMFTQALRFETVVPGEQLSESVAWSKPPAGTYDVRAWLCTNGVDCEATATVSP
jgi:hypothetical protein